MRNPSRRHLLRAGAVLAAGVSAGCLGSSRDESTFQDDFSSGSLESYRKLRGDSAIWDVEEKIDGQSAHVDASVNAGSSLLAPTAEAFEWTGTGEIALDFQVQPDVINKNAIVTFGGTDADESWRVKIALAGQKAKIITPAGQQQFNKVYPDPSAPHSLRITVTETAITVFLDGSEAIQLDGPSQTPTGTVAFGIDSNPSKGGQTWFDDIEFRAD